jgi:tetratricopeptide (TPR) repeat protein
MEKKPSGGSTLPADLHARIHAQRQAHAQEVAKLAEDAAKQEQQRKNKLSSRFKGLEFEDRVAESAENFLTYDRAKQRTEDGDLQGALDLLLTLRPAARAEGDQVLEAKSLQQQGLVLMKLSKWKESSSALQAACILFAEIGDNFGEANTRQTLAAVMMYVGDMKQAQCALEQALALHQEAKNKVGEQHALSALSLVLTKTGEMQIMGFADGEGGGVAGNIREKDLQQGKPSSKNVTPTETQAVVEVVDAATEEEMGEANTLFVLGATRIKAGNYAEANDALEAAKSKYESLASLCTGGDSQVALARKCVKGVANCQQHLGFAHLQLQQFSVAQQALQQAVQLYQELDDQVGLANSLHSVGLAYIKLENARSAQMALSRAVAVYKKLDVNAHPKKYEKAAEQSEKAMRYAMSTEIAQKEGADRQIDHDMRMAKLKKEQRKRYKEKELKRERARQGTIVD